MTGVRIDHVVNTRDVGTGSGPHYAPLRHTPVRFLDVSDCVTRHDTFELRECELVGDEVILEALYELANIGVQLRSNVAWRQEFVMAYRHGDAGEGLGCVRSLSKGDQITLVTDGAETTYEVASIGFVQVAHVEREPAS